MAAISAIPDILSVVEGDYKARSYKAGAAITRGTICGTDASGQAIPFPIAAGTRTMFGVIGVAMDDAALNDQVTIVYEGVVTIACGDDTTGWAIGQLITVGTFAGAGLATVTYTDTHAIGHALTTVAGGGTGKVLLKLR